MNKKILITLASFIWVNAAHAMNVNSAEILPKYDSNGKISAEYVHALASKTPTKIPQKYDAAGVQPGTQVPLTGKQMLTMSAF